MVHTRTVFEVTDPVKSGYRYQLRVARTKTLQKDLPEISLPFYVSGMLCITRTSCVTNEIRAPL